jgi:hypothetical protein
MLALASSASAVSAAYASGPMRGQDARNIFNGTLMLHSGYLDQPFCDVVPSGRWVCTVRIQPRDTTPSHVISPFAPSRAPRADVASFWSDNAGASWSAPVPIEQ